MALLHIDGFDNYATAEAGSAKYPVGAIGGGASTPGRNGLGWKIQNVALVITQQVATDTIVMGFAFARRNASTAMPRIAVFAGDAGATIHLTVNASSSLGQIEVRRGTATGTILGQSATGLFGVNEWHYCEIKAKLHDTTGFVEIRLDGVTIINETNIDTKNAGTGTVFDAIGIAGQASHNTDFDDLYICDTTGSLNNDFLGDVRVATLYPNGAGASTDLIPTGSGNNWENVNSALLNDATFNSSPTPGAKDTYAMGDLPADVDVLGVQSYVRAGKSDAGVVLGRTIVRSDSVDYTGPDVGMASSPRYATVLWETDPATSAQWDPAAVDAMQVGFEVRA